MKASDFAKDIKSLADKVQGYTKGEWVWDEARHTQLESLWCGNAQICSFGDRQDFYPIEGTPPDDADKVLIAESPRMLDLIYRLHAALVEAEKKNDACQDHDDDLEGLMHFYGE